MKRRTLSALAVAACLAGCTVTPWVQPYERGWLADSLMSASRDPLSDKVLQHVHDVREGARGATVAEGGGCGCN